jgi:hypothetical protein
MVSTAALHVPPDFRFDPHRCAEAQLQETVLPDRMHERPLRKNVANARLNGRCTVAKKGTVA